MSDVTGSEIIRFITGQPIRDSDPFDPAWAEVLGKLPPWRRYFGLRCDTCEAEATRKVLTSPKSARYSVLVVFACDTHGIEISKRLCSDHGWAVGDELRMSWRAWWRSHYWRVRARAEILRGRTATTWPPRTAPPPNS